MRKVLKAALVVTAMAYAAAGVAQLKLVPVPLPIDAATASDVQRGMSIADPAGGGAARVVAVTGDRVTVQTARSRFIVPASALRKRGGGLAFAASIADLDALAQRRTVPFEPVRQ